MADANDTLFHIVHVAGRQPVGAPMEEVSGQIRLEFTPASLRTLVNTLGPQAIEALALLIEHGFRPGHPIKVETYGVNWLAKMGMPRHRAQKAITDLLAGGYIEKYRVDGKVTGADVGVMSGFVYGVELDYDGVPRRDGRPSSRDIKKPYNEKSYDDDPVPVYDNPVNGDSRLIGKSYDDPMLSASPQVSPVYDNPVNGNLTATSSTGKEEVLLFANTTTPDFEWAQRFLHQPALVAALQEHRQRSIMMLARAFGDYEMQAAPIAVLFGRDQETGAASEAVARLLIDSICGDVNFRSLLADGRVHNKHVADNQVVLTAFITATITALSTNMNSPPAWFGGMLKNRNFMVNKSARATLTAFDSILQGDLTHDPRVDRPVEASQDSIIHVAKLAIGTPWSDDPISFSNFLRNPSAQLGRESVWEAFSPEQVERMMDLDREVHAHDEDAVTYSAFLAGAVWDGKNQRLIPAPEEVAG